MSFYPFIIAAAAIFLCGWFGHDAYSSKELLNALKKSEKQYAQLKAEQETKRQILEESLGKDRRIAESRLQQALKENAQLRAEADAVVSVELLLLARLCGDKDECTVLGFARPDPADKTAQGTSTIRSVDIYRLLSVIDEQTLETNLRISQLNERLRSCQ